MDKQFSFEVSLAGYKPNWVKFDETPVGEFYRFGPKLNHWMVKNRDGSIVCADWTGVLSQLCSSKTKKREIETFDHSKYSKLQAKKINDGYLLRKGVLEAQNTLSGVLVGEGHLAIPGYDINGSILGYEKISNDGTKKKLKGHPMKGAFFSIGLDQRKSIQELIICEGVSTGCSLFLSTGLPVVVSFGANNLNAVTGKFRSLFPKAKILIAGDDDIKLEKINKPNAGRNFGEEAASNHQCYLVFPEFKHEDGGDFNDLHLEEGMDAVKYQILEAFSGIPEQSKFPVTLLEDCVDEDHNCYKKYRVSYDGSTFEKYIPASEFGDIKKITSIIKGWGLHFDKEQLKEVIAYMDRPAPVKAFVMNNECGWRATGEFYLPPLDKPSLNSDYNPFVRKGSLEHFKEKIHPFLLRNPLLVFILAYSFLPPFLKKFNLPNFGLHLYGQSSIGKTTLLNLAGSIWGAPVENWNGTLLGIEELGHRYRDSLLCLDEVHQIKKENLAQIIYTLANGRGRRRFKSREMFKTRPPFTLNFLSNGESSIREKLKDDFTGGQSIRIIDIDCHRNFGVFDSSSDPENDINEINKIIAENQNYPIKELLDRFDEASILFDKIKLENNNKGQLGRVKALFNCIEKAGIVAVEMGILPKVNIQRSVEEIFSSLSIPENDSFEASKAKERLFELIETNAASFFSGGQFERMPYNLKGYKKSGKFYLTASCLKNDICKDINYFSVKETLLKNNIILHQKLERFGQEVARVYEVNELWFNSEAENY